MSLPFPSSEPRGINASPWNAVTMATPNDTDEAAGPRLPRESLYWRDLTALVDSVGKPSLNTTAIRSRMRWYKTITPLLLLALSPQWAAPAADQWEAILWTPPPPSSSPGSLMPRLGVKPGDVPRPGSWVVRSESKFGEDFVLRRVGLRSRVRLQVFGSLGLEGTNGGGRDGIW